MKKTSKYIFFFLLSLVFLALIPFDDFFKSTNDEIGIINIDYPITSSDDFSKELDYLINKKSKEIYIGEAEDFIKRIKKLFQQALV